ncbi:MAG: tetratricopeptide repeat protein, partial [Clostridia bacterium]|nr:tetratricopeptide repeat protein [Clostridia bacterium]
GLEPLRMQGVRKGTKRFNELQATASKYLDMISESNKANPYYKLYERYSYTWGEFFQQDPQKPPYHLDNIFAKGFRRIYYQKSYFYRPGKWLVIQLRKSKSAEKMRHWIEERIPEERMGENVPIPKSTIMKWKFEYIENRLDTIWETDYSGKNKLEIKNKQLTMDYVMKYFKEILEYNPNMFQGDNVYLWEKAAFIYENMGDLAAMEFCLRTQAKLQPGSSEAYLNLGAFYYGRGYHQKALKAYLQGLTVNPRDEFIYHNLATLLWDEGNYEIAIGYIDQAIKANPERMLNYKLKGDLYFNRMLYQQAVCQYKKALDMNKDSMSKTFYCECYCNLSIALGMMQKKQEALEILKKGLSEYPKDINILMSLSNLFIKNFKNYKKGIYYANKVIEIQPENKYAYKNLVKCYSELGMRDRTIWVKKKFEQIERR